MRFEDAGVGGMLFLSDEAWSLVRDVCVKDNFQKYIFLKKSSPHCLRTYGTLIMEKNTAFPTVKFYPSVALAQDTTRLWWLVISRSQTTVTVDKRLHQGQQLLAEH